VQPKDGRSPPHAPSMQLFDTVHAALERAIQGSALRHTALAENLANVNTPGYRRRDVDFHSALQAAMPAGRGAVQAAPLAAEVDPAAPLRVDGNSVDVDVEAANLAQNALEYEALAQVLRARGDILEIAIGSR
jgi:flagellar basal-body rod protein FlgB